jgi:hypothetical protein
MHFELGYDIITSYKRLSYTPWYALAEFIDNSTQSYFNNEGLLKAEFTQKGSTLEVGLVYDRDQGLIRICDNAMGMSYDELKNALHVGFKPAITTGRSEYGIGMKTAACWLGDTWSVRTKKLGETTEHRVEIDVAGIASGNNALPYEESGGKSLDKHYTIIEITNLNMKFHGRTIGKIREFLSSIYRCDLSAKILKLTWQDSELIWDELDSRLLRARDGSIYKRTFTFEIGGKEVRGWVGVLDRGSRAEAGFSILRRNRVIQGWPESWRPETIFGQYLGSNDLVNQRVVGEIMLNDFTVSHTKNEILWTGDDREDLERELAQVSSDYIQVAKSYRKKQDARGPSDVERQAAIDEFVEELQSPEMVDNIQIEPFELEELSSILEDQKEQVTESVKSRTEAFRVNVAVLTIIGYMEDLSVNDPYVLEEFPNENELLIIINTCHPHWKQLKGSDGVLNYLRHCTYDGVAEWQAGRKVAKITPATIKLYKDRLLRLPLSIELGRMD